MPPFQFGMGRLSVLGYHDRKIDGSLWRSLRHQPHSAKAVGCDVAMTMPVSLLARKQALIERLQDDPGPQEREKIEQLLAEIDEALNSLEEAIAPSRRECRLRPAP